MKKNPQPTSPSQWRREEKWKKTISWIYKQHHSGDFGFVDTEAGDGYFVHYRNRHTALDGDTVQAEVKHFRGREEAIIHSILKRSTSPQSGVYFKSQQKNKKWRSFGFVRLQTTSVTKDIFVSDKHSKWAKDKDVVTVMILDWTGRNPEGKILDVLWNKKKKGVLLEALIAESWFHVEYSETELGKLEKLQTNIPKDELSKRTDLRKLLTYTVDGEDAKDLDDAISLELDKNSRGDFYKLYVHIADVTYFVQEWSSLDKTALKKATSVYLADRVIPMLPKKISNELCSLNNDTEKLTMTCEMRIAKDGAVFHTEVYESIIASDYRFTYKEIDEIIAWKLDDKSDLFWWGKLTSEVNDNIKLANTLKEILIKYKSWKWMLEFDFPETRVLVEDYEVQKIYQYPKYDSNELIEQFMILANESVAFKFKKYPFLYRVHEKPKEESVQKLEWTLENFGIDYSFATQNPIEFQELLSKVQDHPKKSSIEKLVLRTLQKAEYKDKNLGHFWLASKFYSHFTSPIRRYPDLQIHRIIKEEIHEKLKGKRLEELKNLLPKVAKQSSEQEQKAEKLEYKVRDYYICQHYSNKIWEQFSWKVSWLIPAWLFIELADTAEGFVELDKFVYSYEEEKVCFYNKVTGKKISLWDNLRVELIEVDMQRLRLNFEIV